MFIAPFLPEDLDDLLELEPPDWEWLLAHMRWNLATPYCFPLKAVFGEALVAGVGNALAHNGTGWVGPRFVHPHFRDKGVSALLLQAQVDALETQGCRSVTAVVNDEERPLFEALEFRAEGNYIRFADGQCEAPTEDEVELFEPHHAMGVLHLDQRASGEDRRAWISEHLYAGRLYISKGRVLGTYLPLLGEGLVLADNAHAGEELLRWHLPHVTSVVVPEANTVAVEFLRLRKYTEEARMVRMVRGERVPWKPQMEYVRISD
ncbi:MAG: GNAT family N-acetyltransferase [Flavobacteriales bacterium]|nr:GNAT family N-acetyltransferase [Flavobacteriales bacterium]